MRYSQPIPSGITVLSKHGDASEIHAESHPDINAFSPTDAFGGIQRKASKLRAGKQKREVFINCSAGSVACQRRFGPSTSGWEEALPQERRGILDSLLLHAELRAGTIWTAECTRNLAALRQQMHGGGGQEKQYHLP